MKKIFNKLKTSILFYTVVLIVVFLLLHYILGLFNIRFRQWVYYFVPLVSIIGIVGGTIQIIRNKNKKVKIIFGILGLIILIFIIIFSRLILLFLAFSYRPEYVIEKDGKRYVANVNSFLRVYVYYYDYINPILVGNKIKIKEYYGKGGYDPFDGKHDDYVVQEYYCYDNDGKVIKTNNEYYSQNKDKNVEQTIVSNSVEENTEEIIKSGDTLYEKVISDDISIRVKYLGAVLAQRSIIGIEKTTDGGKTWNQQLESHDSIQIHNGAKFVFLNENIGFINDLGLAGTDGENRGLLVTVDGGKNFRDADIVHPNNITEKNLFIDDVPYIENGVLKVKIYTINYNREQTKKYYEFISEDNGITWKYSKEL